MLKNIFFALAMMSCAKHADHQEPAGSLYKFAGKNFTTTNSPCLDGVIVSVDYSCAVPMSIEEAYPYINIQCTQSLPNTPPWDKYLIIAVINPQIEVPDSTMLLCADSHARVYAQKRS